MRLGPEATPRNAEVPGAVVRLLSNTSMPSLAVFSTGAGDSDFDFPTAGILLELGASTIRIRQSAADRHGRAVGGCARGQPSPVVPPILGSARGSVPGFFYVSGATLVLLDALS
jgi:hypothetical protein